MSSLKSKKYREFFILILSSENACRNQPDRILILDDNFCTAFSQKTGQYPVCSPEKHPKIKDLIGANP